MFNDSPLFRRGLGGLATLLPWAIASLSAAEPSGSVKVTWFPNWEPHIDGYRVHYGTESRNYTQTVDAGNWVTTELTDLEPGQTYYAAVTAYNTFGLESDYSNEISFEIPTQPDPPQLLHGVPQSESAKLLWSVDWDPQLVGFRVHFGTESGNYSETLNADYGISTTLPNLTAGETYYAVVTAYRLYGVESDYSNEISFSVPEESAIPPAQRDTDGDGLSDEFEDTYGDGQGLKPFEDPDRDGRATLAEFLHGSDPTMAGSGSPIEVLPMQVGDEHYLGLRYLLDPLALNFVDCQLERSTDPGDPADWQASQTVTHSSMLHPADTSLLEVVERSLHPLSAQRGEFFRMRYSASGAP